MDFWSLLWAWWPVFLALVVLSFLYLLYANRHAIRLYRYARHQPWYNELVDVQSLINRKFDSQLGITFTWEDPKRQRMAILEWPPGGHAALIYRWHTENGIQEMMRYDEDPSGKSIYIPEMYTGGPLPSQAKVIMRSALYLLKYRYRAFQYAHA